MGDKQMIVGARYKRNKSDLENMWGWDYAVLLKVSKVRKKKSNQYPDQTFTVYFYNKEERKNTARRSILEMTCEEFSESFEMSYNLTGIDGVNETYQ